VSGVMPDLIGFDDAFSFVVPPLLLQLLQLFPLEQLKNGDINATPAHTSPSRQVDVTPGKSQLLGWLQLRYSISIRLPFDGRSTDVRLLIKGHYGNTGR